MSDEEDSNQLCNRHYKLWHSFGIGFFNMVPPGAERSPSDNLAQPAEPIWQDDRRFSWFPNICRSLDGEYGEHERSRNDEKIARFAPEELCNIGKKKEKRA